MVDLFRRFKGPNQSAIESLRNKLYQSEIADCWGSQGFVPDDQIAALISKESVRTIFPLPKDMVIEKMRRVIAILIYIERLSVSLLVGMHKHGFTDNSLPVAISDKNTGGWTSISKMAGGTFPTLDSHYRQDETAKTSRAFFAHPSDARKFCEEQWTFLSPHLGGARHLELEPACILPLIFTSSRTSTGGQGEVYQVQFHHTHLDIDPQPTEDQNPHFAYKC
ncbi:hypothetical protein F5Y18DRAFT_392262 [Xylariaceae sp. FL1019]|nr:hypothetical protein F5Y18DRAFT_392262 [Xylariaceae sp. FL1019]